MGKRAYIWLAAWLLLGHAMNASEITQVRRAGTNVTFNLECDRYAHYLIQRSTNLPQWETIRRSFGPSTNRAFNFGATLPEAFFRAVQTNEPVAALGIVAKQTITFSGSGADWPWIDSFDSSNPIYSTGGQYDPAKRKDTAFVASLSSLVGGINTGSGEIYGSAATGPGGTVLGTVGDGAWCVTTTGIQPGHARDDFDLAIPAATLPTVTWQPVPVNGILLNDNYTVTGDVTLTSLGFTVQGKARLWITGNVKLMGSSGITIDPGASLELFIGGTADFGGQGIVNTNTSNCTIWGMPTCTAIKYAGAVDFAGRIYAPHADVQFGSGVNASGAFTAYSFTFSGSSGIHCDEALAR